MPPNRPRYDIIRGKPNGFHYLSHQTTDTDCGIITAVTVTPWDVHDSKPYLEQLEYVHKNVVPIIYDEGQDVYHCPTGKELRPKRLYRSGSGLFWEYWADKKNCDSCPLRAKCLNETDKAAALNIKRMMKHMG